MLTITLLTPRNDFEKILKKKKKQYYIYMFGLNKFEK